MLDLIQSNILDTDIAAHLRKMNNIQRMGKGVMFSLCMYVSTPRTYVYDCHVIS